MTRTTIHTSQGETFTRIGGARILARRIILAALAIGGAIFITAAIIGLANPATHAPAKPITRTQDDTASFNDGVNTELQDLQQIARRPAHTAHNADGSVISDPNGISIIAECLSDTTLTIDELGACIAQPSN